MRSNNYFLYMMGGIGSRFNADKPKQFLDVRGKPVYLRFLETVESFDLIDGVVIVCQKDWIYFVKKDIERLGLKKILSIVPGGSSRSLSVKNGLLCLKQFANNDDVVLIHDATHPFIDKKQTVKLVEEIQKKGAGSLANFVFDTAYIKGDDNRLAKNIDRRTLAIGASPEGFKFGLIYSIYVNSSDEYLSNMTSSGALMADNNVKMVFVETKYPSIKITYPIDLKVYESLLDFFENN